MELTVLQNIWEQYDKKISENTRLNKEILRRMLLSKPEKRLNWIKIKTVIDLILPFILIPFIMVPNSHFRDTFDFYIGLGLFVSFASIAYIWTIKYHIMIGKINFSDPVLSTKKKIKELEKYKRKTTRLRYIFAPFAIIGIFLVANIHNFSPKGTFSYLFLFLVVIVMIFSIYYTFKYSISERFRKLNLEIEEIEQLEKD